MRGEEGEEGGGEEGRMRGGGGREEVFIRLRSATS